MKIKFKDNFSFGACTSSEQSEGHHEIIKTNWSEYHNENPELFFECMGPDIASDVLNRFEEDAKLYKEIGLDSFRTSISWARLFPEENVVSSSGIEFYHKYFDALIKQGIKIYVCLCHFDIPNWVYKKGGFENLKNTDHFLEYAKLVFEEYASKVDLFATFNEPIVPIQFGYQNILHPPGIVDKQRAIKAAYGTILAHSKVVKYFNENYLDKYNAKIGVIVNISPTIPLDGVKYRDYDKKACDKFDLIHNYAMLDAMVKGEFSDELIALLKKEKCYFEPNKEDLEIIRLNKLGFIGINYYSPFRAKGSSLLNRVNNYNNIFTKYIEPYQWSGARINKFRGWEIFPEMLDRICEIIKYRYNNISFYISENGMGVQNEEKFKQDGFIDDEYRISFIKEHLESLNNAIDKYNVDCFGYHVWASIDCWSWANGYKNRYGLIEVDLNTRDRIIKSSGRWYKELSESKSFDNDYKKVDELINTKA